MNEIISYIIGKIIDNAPSFISSRLFPPRKIAPKIRIQLQAERAISTNFTGSIPQIDLYFEIINHSYRKLTLDRMLIDLWFGQPTFQTAILERHVIPANETKKNIHCKYSLTTAQKEYIDKFSNSTSGMGEIQIYIIAYFESNSGLVEVMTTISRSKI